MILKFKKYTDNYLFVNHDTPVGDVYYCDCGEIFAKVDTDDDLKNELITTSESINNMSVDEEMMTEFKDIYKGVKLGTEEEVRCPGCDRNFQSSFNKENFVVNKESFISGYSFVETKDSLMLYYSVIKTDLNSLECVNFSEEYKYLRFEKDTKKLFIKDFKLEEREFDLDEVINIVNSFFVFDTAKVVNLFDMHLFVGRIANFIMDAKNINIVQELLENLRSKVGDSGLEVIKKITSMFFGIIKYSNLSTIAMTKSSIFLYDLMSECKIPKPQVLIDNQITSPIKIFNFLIQNYINKLNEEVNSDNKDVHAFTFKSKTRIDYDEKGDNVNVTDLDEEKIIQINITNNNSYQDGKVKIDKGQYQVEDAVSDGSVSKFIFKKINHFSEYKKIIKFFKLVNKQELIILLQRYDIDFLTTVIDLLYFRNKTSFKDLEKMLDIIYDYTALKSKENCAVMDGVLRINYSFTKGFNFISYDDTLMMMEVLQFDPKVDFNKIRTWKELNEYHDNLVKYFAVLKDEEKNGSIMDFVSKFKFLEHSKEYDSPIEIRLLSTPGMIIKEGIEMRHSASAYARNVAQGRYLMGQIYDRDPERTNSEPDKFTIGFTYDKLAGLEFDQVKGFANELGEGIPKKTDRFKKLMMEWLTAKDISFRPINDLKLTGDNVNNDSKI